MKKDQSSSLVWLALAILIGAETLRKLSFGSFRDPGPGFVPIISGIILGILSLIHYIQSFLDKGKRKQVSGNLPERWKALLIVYTSLISYVFLLEPLGFLVATFFLLFILFRIAESRPWTVLIGASALTSMVTFLIFDVFLKCQLPKGILSF
jgi:putative tricarboxylic transport membrane protein